MFVEETEKQQTHVFSRRVLHPRVQLHKLISLSNKLSSALLVMNRTFCSFAFVHLIPLQRFFFWKNMIFQWLPEASRQLKEIRVFALIRFENMLTGKYWVRLLTVVVAVHGARGCTYDGTLQVDFRFSEAATDEKVLLMTLLDSIHDDLE